MLEQKNDYLNDLYKAYKNGTFNKKSLEEKIYSLLIQDYKENRVHYGRKGCYMDFLCWFYVRLTRAIDNYTDTGNTFDAYIQTLLYYSYKEFRRKEKKYEIENLIIFEDSDSGKTLYVNENEPSYTADYDNELPTDSVLFNLSSRYALILILKNYRIISEEAITNTADKIGMDKNEIFELVNKLKKIRKTKDENQDALTMRIQAQYVRCLKVENLLNYHADKEIHSEVLQARLERFRLRLANMRHRREAMRQEAANSEVAQVMGIPKGSVDSSMFYIKKMLKRKGSREED